MEVTGTPFTIADYCAAMKRNEIKVNHDYQRTPKVWPPAAKSFLIETILLGYPMPKLSLYQLTDVKSRQTIKEIVDGQQRSVTILEFYEGKLRLSSRAIPTSAAGKKYSELDEELQHKFLNYSLSVDLFINATMDDILEVFRRINSYTVPLNAEEKRHSKYQGDFKWFIYRQSRKYSKAFSEIGTFTERQLNRMQDAKLLSEFCHAILNGIATTKEGDLTKLYEKYDKKFPEVLEMEKRIRDVMDYVLELKDLHRGPLMKPYQLYSLMLAVTHFQSNVAPLLKKYKPKKSTKKVLADSNAERNLSILAAVLEDPDAYPKYGEFFEAGSEKTNVADQRAARFIWCCRAFDDDLP
jgi:Protein of unknown function DUF262